MQICNFLDRFFRFLLTSFAEKEVPQTLWEETLEDFLSSNFCIKCQNKKIHKIDSRKPNRFHKMKIKRDEHFGDVANGSINEGAVTSY